MQRCYLCREEGTCVYVCVWRVHALVCVGWRGKGRVCCKGSRVVCLKVPEGAWISSCPFILSWKNCILSIWGRETSPSGSGAKGGKTYDTATQVKTGAVRYSLMRNSWDDENDSITHQRNRLALFGLPRWRSWSRRQRWVQQTSCCTGTQHKSCQASCTAQSLPGDQIEWCLTRYNKMLFNLWMDCQNRRHEYSDYVVWAPSCGNSWNYKFCICMRMCENL